MKMKNMTNREYTPFCKGEPVKKIQEKYGCQAMQQRRSERNHCLVVIIFCRSIFAFLGETLGVLFLPAGLSVLEPLGPAGAFSYLVHLLSPSKGAKMKAAARHKRISQEEEEYQETLRKKDSLHASIRRQVTISSCRRVDAANFRVVQRRTARNNRREKCEPFADGTAMTMESAASRRSQVQSII